MPPKKQPKKKKTGRKKFFEVKIPLTSTKIHLYGFATADFHDKIVKLDMTRALRGKNLELKARIKSGENELKGQIISLQILPSFIKRMMRKGVNYVEDSFRVQSKDSVISIKPFLITRKKVSRAVRKELREQARKNIEAKVKLRNTKEILSEIMTNKFQKELSLKLKKIYPLALCEIRVFRVLEKETEKMEKSEKKDISKENTEKGDEDKKKDDAKEEKKQ